MERALSELKETINASNGLRSLKFHELWARMLTHFTDEYSRVLRLVVVALLIPADTSECERVFSLMNDLKTSGLSCLGQANLKNMLMIWQLAVHGHAACRCAFLAKRAFDGLPPRAGSAPAGAMVPDRWPPAGRAGDAATCGRPQPRAYCTVLARPAVCYGRETNKALAQRIQYS